MIVNFKYNIKKNILFLILIIFLSHQNSFFSNIYTIYKRDYDERMLRIYGYCNSYGYGYIDKIYKKYLKIENKIFILNFEVLPEVYGLFPNLKKSESKENLILINYNNSDYNELNNLEIDLNEFDLIDQEDQCFYYRKIKG